MPVFLNVMGHRIKPMYFPVITEVYINIQGQAPSMPTNGYTASLVNPVSSGVFKYHGCLKIIYQAIVLSGFFY
jgi:hypothetical protein